MISPTQQLSAHLLVLPIPVRHAMICETRTEVIRTLCSRLTHSLGSGWCFLLSRDCCGGTLPTSLYVPYLAAWQFISKVRRFRKLSDVPFVACRLRVMSARFGLS